MMTVGTDALLGDIDAAELLAGLEHAGRAPAQCNLSVPQVLEILV